MTSINDIDIAHRETLILNDYEVATVSFNVGNWPFKLRISFEPRANPDDATFQAEVEPDALRWRLIGWDSSVGTTLQDPVEVARLQPAGRLMTRLYHFRTGKTSRVDLQFSVEGE